ncbi:multicopper oxidase domain-containing protein [uncultured Ilyobacter sp.]|uniref:multicopper oxidase domain-containing protein n=1 Tax=uncultured Ilyobacter sp. TaxID=544433 RepID=UPI002AA7B076|nr:multicopper oxidase domain-containing protein [uncultured Ilyobacter sp.]
MKKIWAILLYIVIFTFSFSKLVEYEVDIAYTEVNFTGNPVKAMTLNGGIPGPTLEFTEGDILRVTFNNYMDVETSIHWHGLLVPNDQDGVPYLNTPPILPGTSFTYEIPLIQSGTYWYHSHTGLQEQRGVYGSIVIHPKEEEKIEEYVVVVSDWTDEDPVKILKNLKKDGDYYALKRNRVQSWEKVLKERRIKERINGALMRMGPMDLSDVGYDAYLINGEKEISLGNIPAGTSVKLRIINAAASTYFNLSYSKGNMEVVAADGIDVMPVGMDKILIGVAETYDVIIESGGVFVATAQDNTGKASLHVGKTSMGTAEHNKYKMPEGNNMQEMDSMTSMMESSEVHDFTAMKMAENDMGHTMHQMPEKSDYYDFLKARESTEYSKTLEERVIELRVTGDMENYIWTFNNKALIESDKILIKKGERVKFILKNETMMHHPLHLHGHFFRVINKHGTHSPLKHTVDVPPMQTIEIEFLANEEKDWFFHCHNLYHMKAGMSRIISYDDSYLDKKIAEKLSWDKRWFHRGEATVASNYSGLDVTTFNSRNTLEFSGDASYDGEHDLDVYYSRYINRFLSLGIGYNMEEDDEEIDNRGFISVEYLLPLLIDSEFKLYDDGDLEAEFSSELQLTDKLQFNWEADAEGEYLLELEYRYRKWLSFVANAHSKYDEGIGIRVRF